MADKKFNRIRVILRHYKPSIFGLRSLQLSSTRFTQRESPNVTPTVPPAAAKAPGAVTKAQNVMIDDWEDFSDSESVVEAPEVSKQPPTALPTAPAPSKETPKPNDKQKATKSSKPLVLTL